MMATNSTRSSLWLTTTTSLMLVCSSLCVAGSSCFQFRGRGVHIGSRPRRTRNGVSVEFPSYSSSSFCRSSVGDADSTTNESSVGGGVLDLVFGFVKTKVAYQFSNPDSVRPTSYCSPTAVPPRPSPPPPSWIPT
mmetsp:Transcript_19893/g.35983  ORF Transcript_19893/g.35983 Transcript_19893/m.35983 type:complete len:135 (-) Transcript_19893:1045-1449(-)